MKKLSFITLAIIFLTTSYKTSAQVSQLERDALIALYNATGGENWIHNDNWKIDATPEEVTSDWYGVTVEGGHVTYLYLQSNNLRGEIPPEIGAMTSLDYLRLENNQLTGQIPTQIGGLSNLRVLNLSNNNLEGDIPVEFYNLTGLTGAQMYNNNLTGSISPLIGNLTNLRSLYLYDNQLTGNIPQEIGNLTLLNYLFLNGNQLDGNIPEEIGNLTNLLSLSLQQNKLTGILPTSLGNLNKLTLFKVGNNLLEGEVLASLFNIATMENFQLNDNRFSGNVSTNVDGMINLQYLYLNGNQFSGDFPVIDRLNALVSLRLNNNQFENLPDFTGLTSLSILNVEDNKLTFEDILPNTTNTNFTYSPQKEVGQERTLQVSIGAQHTISVNVGGTGNTYQWYKNGVEISGATAADYTISSFAETDAGGYHCQIDNPNVVLTLLSKTITLSVSDGQNNLNINLPEGSNGSLTGLGSGTLLSNNGSFNFLPENLPATGLLTIENPDGSITNIQFDVDENGNISNVQIEVEGLYIPMYQEFFTTSEGNLVLVHLEDVCVYR